jgi:secondary thiamine-phosphate synthase enzyme
MKEITIKTTVQRDLIDITAEVQKAVLDHKKKEGVCLVFVPHTTAGIFINETHDTDLRKDLLDQFNRMIPVEGGYRHAGGNADAHIKGSVIGCSLSIPVDGGILALGQWQGIYFFEGDGPRERKIKVSVY